MTRRETTERRMLHVGIGGIIVGAAAALVIQAMVYGVSALLPAFGPAPHVPAILEDLPEKNAPAISAFQERVFQRFPVGTEERALIEELWSDGFKLNHDPSSGAPMAVYGLHEEGSRFWTITWTAENGKIASIQTGFGINDD